ncbi:hypothetical protein CEXT_519001 [Caerostris extrusa]|uniref:Uncharacterized protein n=1 Tax=Caerostris extrusa TaxID=172846 RepID=A0AAV4WTX4_CAEEX|nr:hypothetical protein CEXT_519001 [Caerostris extrusa]
MANRDSTSHGRRQVQSGTSQQTVSEVCPYQTLLLTPRVPAYLLLIDEIRLHGVLSGMISYLTLPLLDLTEVNGLIKSYLTNTGRHLMISLPVLVN